MPQPRARRGFAETFDFEGAGDEARDWLDSLYATPLGVRGPMGGVAHQRLAGDGVAVDHLRIDASITFDVEEMPVLVVVDVLSGEVEYTRSDVTDRARDGDTVLAAGWHEPFTGSGDSYEVRNTSISADVLAAAVQEVRPDRTGEDVVFSSLVPRSAAAGARWRATLDELSASFPSRDEPIALGEASRLVGHTLLHTFANNVVGDPGSDDARDQRDATHSTLRRAQAVIQARCHEDLPLAELARECRVTPRALQYAFRHHLGCTPQAYLKQVRLDLVHQELCDGSTATVSEVAVRFGFFNPGRFADDYRQVFGENPRQTLARSTS